MDQADFLNIYSDHKEMVWKLVSRYVSEKTDREDLFQEVFLNIYKALKKFRGDSALGTWIYRITVNASINRLRKQRRYKKLQDVLKGFRIAECVEERASEISDGSLLKPLERLNPQQRMILLLSDVEEKELAEIAGMLNIPIGTVKSNLHRAREIIQKEVMKNGGI